MPSSKQPHSLPSSQSSKRPLSSPLNLAYIHSPVAHHTIIMRRREDSPDAASSTYDDTLKASIPRIFSASRAFQSIMGLDRKAPMPFLPPPRLPEWKERLVEQWRVTDEWNEGKRGGGSLGLCAEDSVGWSVGMEDSGEEEIDERLEYELRDEIGQAGAIIGREAIHLRSEEGMNQYEKDNDNGAAVDQDVNDHYPSSSEHNSSQRQEGDSGDEEADRTMPFSQAILGNANGSSGMDTVEATPSVTPMDSFRTIPTIIISSPPSPPSQSSETHTSSPLNATDQTSTNTLNAQNPNKRTNTAQPSKSPARKKRRSLPWSLKPKPASRPISYTPDLTNTLLSWYQFTTRAHHHFSQTITATTSHTTPRSHNTPKPTTKTKTIPNPLSIPSLSHPTRDLRPFPAPEANPPHWTTPPKSHALISLSLQTLHPSPTELLRFEPSDMDTLRWVEVDTWIQPNSQGKASSYLCKMKMPREQGERREKERECASGRWMCLVVRRYADVDANMNAEKEEEGREKAETRVHWTIAWPAHAVTRGDECVKYIHSSYHHHHHNNNNNNDDDDDRDGDAISPPTSLSDAPLLHPNSTHPPPPTSSKPKIAEGLEGLSLRRTTLDFEKAGSLPLVESVGTDARLFEEWIEAVGMGCARVVVWTRAEERIWESGEGEGKRRERGGEWLGGLWEEREWESER